MSEKVTVPDVYGTTHEIDTHELRWRPSAYGIVIKDSKLLVSPEFNGYDLPGGGLELGELPEQAVVREIKEETGLDVINPRPVSFRSNFFLLPGDKEGSAIQSILLYYVCEFVDGELSDAGFDEREKQHSHFPEWLPLDRLDSIKVTSSIDWREFVHQVVGDR
jgi:8-oxo-dGTP diphosphatase